MDPFKYYIGSI